MIKAILLKPLDGDLEGTEREFDTVDFDRLAAMGAVRVAGDSEKAAPAVANKMAPTLANKMAPDADNKDIRRSSSPKAVRDENGDTPEMAELRRLFDVSFAERSQEIENLKLGLSERDNTIAALQERVDVLQAPQTTASVYAVLSKASGWNVVTKDGVPVTKSLRDDAVKDFDGKSDEDKATFVEANKPEA